MATRWRSRTARKRWASGSSFLQSSPPNLRPPSSETSSTLLDSLLTVIASGRNVSGIRFKIFGDFP